MTPASPYQHVDYLIKVLFVPTSAPLKRVKRTDLRVAREHFVVLRCLSLFRIHLTLVEGAGVTQLMDILVGPVDIVGTQTRMIPV